MDISWTAGSMSHTHLEPAPMFPTGLKWKFHKSATSEVVHKIDPSTLWVIWGEGSQGVLWYDCTVLSTGEALLLTALFSLLLTPS